jgi:RNA polymerase sigma-70 factor (sigma-E family)
VDVESDFDEFVRLRSPALLRAAWLLTGDWASAQDVVQSALERAWPRWPALVGREHEEAYVRRVMMTVFLRDRSRRWTAEIPFADLPDRHGSDLADLVAGQVSVAAALLRLPARQRAVLAWRYFADLTEAQTAYAMGCRVGTVKSYTARALTALRANEDLVGFDGVGGLR